LRRKPAQPYADTGSLAGLWIDRGFAVEASEAGV